MKRRLLDNVKNIPGWRTNEKLVVLSVDDYGNVRLSSAGARDRLVAAGLDMSARFDRFDSLETRQDLAALFEVLSSVSDSEGNAAIFTAYALSANPDFSGMAGMKGGYRYEPLPITFERLAVEQPAAYNGAWESWQDGVRLGLLKPQFHGREHINVELLERKLCNADKALDINLANHSMAALGDEASMPGVGFTHAFEFWDESSVANHRNIIADGLQLFEEVFGFPSLTFTPPAQKLHPELYSYVESLGVRGIDKPRHCMRRLDRTRETREINSLGRRRGQGHVSIVRNVVFEPTNILGFDSVSLALDQVAAAFRWRKPAIISSHRVNFSGHIEPENRKLGLDGLKRLLTGIVRRWPDVKFISADELVEKISPSI